MLVECGAARASHGAEDERVKENTMLSLILLVFAFVLACLASKNFGAPNWALGWVALACFFLSLILGNQLLHLR